MRYVKSKPQAGMTLVECLVSMAISVTLLSGLAEILNLGLAGFRENQIFSARLTNVENVVKRLTWAIESADRKKKSELSDKAGRDNTSDTWFYRTGADGKTLVLRYEWNAASKTLNEYDDQNIARAILTNVTSFNVTSPATTDTDSALILVTMTVDGNHAPVTYTLSRPLGNAW